MSIPGDHLPFAKWLHSTTGGIKPPSRVFRLESLCLHIKRNTSSGLDDTLPSSEKGHKDRQSSLHIAATILSTGPCFQRSESISQLVGVKSDFLGRANKMAHPFAAGMGHW